MVEQCSAAAVAVQAQHTVRQLPYSSARTGTCTGGGDESAAIADSAVLCSAVLPA